MGKVEIKWNDAAAKRMFAPVELDRTKSESQQVSDTMKELKKRGVTPDRSAVTKMVRDANKN
ncbi:hypothetical protein [Sanguibacter suaedae]|uniref:Uncharacterized protein n=1 Tax=Sanguibacter suaedae TaxID=2795737 RepID=A0A934M6I9_9MICO|nr:hypothetical protein [Sanguibacter suaedae]MBI9114297.1 hypothetical protein [Sanguibacter suaedae]